MFTLSTSHIYTIFNLRSIFFLLSSLSIFRSQFTAARAGRDGRLYICQINPNRHNSHVEPSTNKRVICCDFISLYARGLRTVHVRVINAEIIRGIGMPQVRGEFDKFPFFRWNAFRNFDKVGRVAAPRLVYLELNFRKNVDSSKYLRNTKSIWQKVGAA